MKNLKELILQDFRKKSCLTSAELMKKFKVSRQAVHRHLTDLIQRGHIIKQGTSRATTYYVLNTPGALKKLSGKKRCFKKRLDSFGLSEERVFNEIGSQANFLRGLTEDARENFHYAFTEMLNNAIDHSGSKLIDVGVEIDKNDLVFSVRDTGVGVFENIRTKKGLTSELEAVQDLLKGRTTTAPKEHSGEGIFFTSKIADRFVLESHKKRLIVDNTMNDIFLEDRRFLKGTCVYFRSGIGTNRELTAVFRKFTNEDFQFDKSRVRVKLFDSGDSYMSRSQAKRLLHTLERFGEIVLDFSGVSTVGQAFADEVFRVFQRSHPKIRINVANCSENVDFMIKRAIAMRSND